MFASTQKSVIRNIGVLSLLSLFIIGGLILKNHDAVLSEVDVSEAAISETPKAVDSSKLSFPSQLQLRFIENQGQAGVKAKYHVQGASHTVLFHQDKVVLKKDVSLTAKNEIVLRFAGANQSPTVLAGDKLAGVAHFYKGQNPNQWHTNVPTYKSVKYAELYPGIDMAYLGAEGVLESEFYLAPGIDYHQIRLDYQGVQSRTIRDDGALVLKTELGDLIEKAPFAYQDINGARVEVEAEYTILADASIGFELSSYDSEFPLVIDPQLAFITVVPGFGGEFASAVVQDASGNIIAAGGGNRFFPANDVIDASNHVGGLGNDGLLIKTDSVGNVIFSALFGGTKPDYFTDIATDASGSLYLTGFTSSKDFPVLNPAQDSSGGQDDAFLVILDSTGVLMYGTYLGGSNGDFGNGIAIDSSGNIYIGGTTASSDYPTLNAFQSTLLGSFTTDVFLAKYNPLGELIYSTFLGGSDKDRLSGLEVTSDGQLTVTGGTLSEDFPLMNPYQDTLGGIKWSTGDIFVCRLNAAGNALIYSTYFGGIEQEWSYDLALGPDGSAYVCGGAVSPNFPIVNGISVTPEADSTDGILICLDNSGQPTYSVRTYIPGYDNFLALAVDASSNAFPVGNWLDSIRVYQKSIDSALEVNIQVAAPGHSINGVNLQNNSLAFVTTYFPPSASLDNTGNQYYTSSSLSNSNAGVGLLRILDLFDTQLINGRLSILIKKTNSDGLRVGRDENGFVTLNGVSTNIKADDVEEIKVVGSEGDDKIDLSQVTLESFPNIVEILNSTLDVVIDAAGGDDEVRAPIDIASTLKGGEGNDRLFGGNKGDELLGGNGDDELFGNGGEDLLEGQSGRDVLIGGLGDDHLVVDKDDEGARGGDGNDRIILETSGGQQVTGMFTGDVTASNNYKTVSGVANTVTIADSSGIDTLSFAGYSQGVTLDLEIQNTPQTIDANGVQIILDGIFEVVNASAFDDEITIAPLLNTPRHIDGRAGIDVLNIAPVGVQSTDDGSTITTPGYADITYTNIETVHLPIITDVQDENSALPFKFTLHQNYPNPFNPTTIISYSIPTKAEVTIAIYNVLGREVRTFASGQQSAGEHSVTWDATDQQGTPVASGMYFYKITAGEFNASRKMVLLK